MPRGRQKKIRFTAQDENPQMSLMPEYDFDFVKSAIKKVKLAWELHTESLHNESPMLLAFSGGKDSVCLYYVCKMASEELGVPFGKMFHAQYNITNLDPPELVRFVREKFPDVEMHHPEKSFWKLLIEKKQPPFRTQRWCCSELKEISSLPNAFSLTGVRRAESRKRAERTGVEGLGKRLSDRITLLNDNDELRKDIDVCALKRAWVCNPLIDWSDEQVWAFIKHQDLPYCSLYDEGFHRLGCIGCPLASERERDSSRDGPDTRNNTSLSSKGFLTDTRRKTRKWQPRERERERDGLRHELCFSTPFLDGQDMFDWWMYRPAFKERHQSELAKMNNELFKEFDDGHSHEAD